MRYKNFDLYISHKAGDCYQIKAQSESMGSAEGRLTLDPEWLRISDDLKKIEIETNREVLENLGRSFYHGLFAEDIRDLLLMCLGEVLRDEDQGVRIRLFFSPPEIAALPWEVLFDQRTKSYLSTSGKTPLTRFIELLEPIKSLKTEAPVRVLVVIPEGAGLDVEREKAIITEALTSLESVKISFLEGKVTRSEISHKLTEDQYHILHFIGHGIFKNDQGFLLLNSERDGRDRIPASDFADFFRDYPSMKLIVLNSCQGAEVSSTLPLAGMAPQLVARGIPAVIAMQYPISDKAALVFAKEFYLKLCKGWSRGQVDMAISHARNRIHMDIGETLAFATPVLFMRSPTGIIFDLQAAGPAPEAGVVSTFKRTTKNFFDKFTSPVKNISRLKQVKETYQSNIDVLQKKENESPGESTGDARTAIADEQKEMLAIDERIIKWQRTLAASLIGAVLIFLLGYVGLLNSPWWERKFILYMDDYVAKKFSPNIRLILADEGVNGGLGEPGPNWRQYHAQLIDALTEAKAKVIVFDLYMQDPTPYDSDLAASIKRASERGTHVLIGKAFDLEGNVIFDLPDELQPAIKDQWGNIDVGGLSDGFVRVYQLAQPLPQDSAENNQSKEVPIIPSLGLQTVVKYFSKDAPVKAFFDQDKDQIQIRSDNVTIKSIPVSLSANAPYDFPFDLADQARLTDATRSYQDVYARRNEPAFLRDYKDKIVVIGYKTSDDRRNVLHGKVRYGTEIHANVISNILSNVYIRLLPTSYDFLIVALMAFIGGLIRARFRDFFSFSLPIPFTQPKKQIVIPGLLFVADFAYLVVAFVVYKYELVFILKFYHLVAPFITYWLTGPMRKRRRLIVS